MVESDLGGFMVEGREKKVLLLCKLFMGGASCRLVCMDVGEDQSCVPCMYGCGATMS